MKTPFLLLVAVLAFISGCGETSDSPSASETTSASGNPLDAPAEYVGALGSAQQKAMKTADTATLNQAIQLFQVEHGRYPKDLNELVSEKFLTAVPEAPYGMKIVYDAATGNVKIVKQ